MMDSIQDRTFHCSAVRHFMETVKKFYNQENGNEDAEMNPADLVEQASAVVESLSQAANLSQAEQILLAASQEQRQTEAYTRLQSGILVAEKKVQNGVSLLVDGGTEHEGSLTKGLKESVATTIRGNCDSQQYVAVVMDGKVFCESGSQAKWRLPPTRTPQMKRLLGALLATRDDGDLDDADVVVALDGGKGGDWEEKNIVKHLPGKRYNITKHVIFYNHASVEKRMERASKGPLDLTEAMSFISVGGTPLQTKARLSEFQFFLVCSVVFLPRTCCCAVYSYALPFRLLSSFFLLSRASQCRYSHAW